MAKEYEVPEPRGTLWRTIKAGDELFIGDNIRIIVTKNDFGHLRLGISAPKSVRISRSTGAHQRVTTKPVDGLSPLEVWMAYKLEELLL